MNDNNTNIEKGKKAEDLASEYLVSKGFNIIKRNFHFGKTGELDIVCQIGSEIIFVEVRSKQSNSTFDPILSLTPSKIKSIRKSAEGFIFINKLTDFTYRFDFITIDFTKAQPKIEHLENAF